MTALAQPRPSGATEGSRRSLDALRALVEATNLTGQPFFEALVVNLARSLGVRHALVGELVHGGRAARTLAVAWDGARGDSFLYALRGTPCAEVIRNGELAYHPRGVAALFPEDLALARLGIEAYMGAPLLAPNGAKVGVLVVLHDQPLDESVEPAAVLQMFAGRAAAELARLRSEEARRHSEDLLGFALDAAGMATFDWDVARRRARWSDGIDAVLGLPPDGFGRGLDDLAAVAHPDDRGLLARASGDALAGRAARLDVEFRVVAGESTRWVHLQGRATRREEGVRVSGVVADVTQRHELEAGLRHAQKMEGLGRLAGGVAHDFNNLLTVIRSFTELAEAHLAADPTALELVQPIREAADRAANLTRQLLAFARRQVAEPRTLALDPVIDGLARLLSRLLGEHIRLQVRPGAPDAAVRIDPGQLEQVLVNLAVNARDAMATGGVLTLATDVVQLDPDEARLRQVAAGAHVRIRVKDSGRGMDAATLSRAFEPFFTTKGPDRGTGLGLATCHGIVVQAGGAIWLESEPGLGTTATFLLPRVEAEAPHARGRGPLAARGDATVLFVEDEEPVRALATRALTGLGYRVLSARDGVEALSLVLAHAGPIHLLVTDLVLPHMDGREVARRVLALRPGVRVLYASGYPGADPVAPLEESEAFLQKPYTPSELGARIAELLK